MTETTASGKWREPGFPHKGWSCVDVQDLEDPLHTCEVCETSSVRYVHWLTHPNYPQQLGAGCVCAGHLTEDLVGAQNREKSAVNIAKRRAKWLTRKWRVSGNGNPFLNTDGYNVVVFRRKGAVPLFGYRIVRRDETEAAAWSPKDLPSEDMAKLAALPAMLALKARDKAERTARAAAAPPYPLPFGYGAFRNGPGWNGPR